MLYLVEEHADNEQGATTNWLNLIVVLILLLLLLFIFYQFVLY